jgi:hypothetical protein
VSKTSEQEARYCRECGRKLSRLANGDMIWCCPLGQDGEEVQGDLVAFEATNGTKYGSPLPPLDVTKLTPGAADLLHLVMQEFGGVAWERDILGKFRGRVPTYATNLNPLVFRREGYRVADNVPCQDFRVFVTDLAFDGWMAEYGKGKRR